MIILTNEIAKIIPKIPNNVCVILVLTLGFWSTSTTAYMIKLITKATPASEIPTANAQSVICLITFKMVSTVYER